MEALSTILGIGMFFVFIWAYPRVKGQIWWALSDGSTITENNIRYCVEHYGPPPNWWVAKHGTPWEARPSTRASEPKLKKESSIPPPGIRHQ